MSDAFGGGGGARNISMDTEMRVFNGYIQFKFEGQWVNLIALSALSGKDGAVAVTFVADANVQQTAALALSAGIRTITASVPGVVVGGLYMVFPTAAMPAGYALHDVLCLAADQLKINISAPLLALGASFTIPVKVFKLNP